MTFTASTQNIWDQTIYKVGLLYKIDDLLTWRAGLQSDGDIESVQGREVEADPHEVLGLFEEDQVRYGVILLTAPGQSRLLHISWYLQSGPLEVQDYDGGSWCWWRQLSFEIKTRLEAPPFRCVFMA